MTSTWDFCWPFARETEENESFFRYVFWLKNKTHTYSPCYNAMFWYYLSLPHLILVYLTEKAENTSLNLIFNLEIHNLNVSQTGRIILLTMNNPDRHSPQRIRIP